MSGGEIAEIPIGFRERLEFHNSRLKLVGLLCLTILLVAAGYFCTTLPALLPRVIGWVGVCFFGLGFIVIPVSFFRSGAQVIIDLRGIEDRRMKIGVIPWEEIVEVRMARIESTKFLVLQLKEPRRYLDQMKPWQRKLAAANRAIGFSDISIGFVGLNPSIDDAWKHLRYICSTKVPGWRWTEAGGDRQGGSTY